MPQDHHSARRAHLTPFQRFLSHRLVTATGMFLSKFVPPPIGHAVATLIAALIYWLKPEVYWILCANLRQALGPQVEEEELHRLAQRVLRHNARNDYDLWHTASHGPGAVRAAVDIPPEVWGKIDQALQRGKGAIIVGTHTGNFDLGILALAAHGKEVLVLGLPIPPAGGFNLMDRLRELTGARLTPSSAQGLKEAIRHLRAGGIVLTGVDRPEGDVERPVEFFGRPAPLPTGHVWLALKTDAAILVAGPHYSDEQRRTVVEMSPPLEMERTGNPEEDLRANLRRVTGWLERYIRAWPDQWAMFMPVWPEQNKTST